MTLALPSAIRTALASNPSADETALCRAVLAPWLPPSLPEGVQAPAREACHREARRAVAQAAADRAKAIAEAITARATRLAAPILAASRSYDGLLAHGWFGQPPASWDGIVPAGSPEDQVARTRAQAEYDR